MEIASSNPLSIPFSFDPKSVLRQIVEVLVGEFRSAPGRGALRTAQVLVLPAYEPRLADAALPSRASPGRRSSTYAPRWG